MPQCKMNACSAAVGDFPNLIATWQPRMQQILRSIRESARSFSGSSGTLRPNTAVQQRSSAGAATPGFSPPLQRLVIAALGRISPSKGASTCARKPASGPEPVRLLPVRALSQRAACPDPQRVGHWHPHLATILMRKNMFSPKTSPCTL